MKHSTITSRISESFKIMKQSFLTIGFPYVILAGIGQIPTIFFQEEYITWVQQNILLFWLATIVFLFVIMIIVLAFRKCVIETYLVKRGKMTLTKGVWYVLSNIKGISYIYWRILVELIPAIIVSVVLLICMTIIGSIIFAGSIPMIIVLAGLSYIPIIKSGMHLIFISSHALWHDDYTKEGTIISEKATRGIFWSILGNYGIVFMIPIIFSSITSGLSSMGIFLPIPMILAASILNIFIGLIGVIYMLVYYRDLILPRELVVTTSESV